LKASPSLLTITAHARSGALDHAWRLFREGGYERARNDPSALSLKGRLLKDQALRAEGAARRALYLDAANAYASAGRLDGRAYPLINAATLSLLAGQPAKARKLARQVLAHGGDRNETAYYQDATRAEALLLLDDLKGAAATLTGAVARAPQAYEDHASTLRQFELILDALDEDKGWLDALRPPRALHFAGHMEAGADTARAIRTLLERERIGFGYGALAAGADILIAEALLRAGAELHLVLPAPERAFRDASVTRHGKDWVRRFHRVLGKARSIRTIPGGDTLSPLALRLAAEVAMGEAVMRAATLSTEAVQLVVLDRQGRRDRTPGGSGWIASTWKRTGRRQHILVAPRRRAARRPLDRVSGAALAAMLRIDVPDPAAARLTEDILPWIARALAAGAAPCVPIRWTGESVLAAFDTPQDAARAALSAAAVMEHKTDLRIAGNYAIVRQAKDPFGGGPFLAGAGAALLAPLAQATPFGAIHLTGDFAAALHSSALRPRTEYVGELEDAAAPIPLYSLKR